MWNKTERKREGVTVTKGAGVLLPIVTGIKGIVVTPRKVGV